MCLRGTRKGLLLEIDQWITNKGSQPIFLLNGLAGTGKSTVAQTFAKTSFAEGNLGASFFCSRDSESRNNLRVIFPTIAYQLAKQCPKFRAELLQVLTRGYNAGQQSLCLQMEKLIVGPLGTTHTPTLIIIDALDECRDEQPASVLLSVLASYVKQIPNVKFLITGRPELQIYAGFRLKLLLPTTEILKFHEIEPEVLDNDIKLFFQTHFTKMAKSQSDCNTMGDWPSSSDIDTLCQKAAGFFIYAATVTKFINSDMNIPSESLSLITSLPQITEEGRSQVEQLYIKVLEKALPAVHASSSQAYIHFKIVVGTVLLVFNPLSIKTLSELLGMPDIQTIIHPLNPLLLIPKKLEDPISSFHKSFPDFLTNPERCTDDRFLIVPAIHHMRILISCLTLMREKLKKNICNLDEHAVLSEIKDLSAQKRNCIGDALEYACKFWTNHLLTVPTTSSHVQEVQGAVDEFFTICLLYWIEVLALTGNLEVGVYAMNDIEQWYTLVSTA